MNREQTIEKHIAALQGLYKRITEVAKSMGGTAMNRVASRRVTVNVAIPRSDDVPALNVEMPGGFQIEFAPPNTLSGGNALSVQARRIHHGGRKNDWTFNFLQGAWLVGETNLSDEEIRRCLTSEGPPALY